jgi:hypothetical protein
MISKKKLIMSFSAFDIDLPVIAAGIRERMDVLRELDVAFAGFGTEIPQEMTEQTPAQVKAFFEYIGTASDSSVILKRVYHLIWGGMIQEFPDLDESQGGPLKSDHCSGRCGPSETGRLKRQRK